MNQLEKHLPNPVADDAARAIANDPATTLALDQLLATILDDPSPTRIAPRRSYKLRGIAVAVACAAFALVLVGSLVLASRNDQNSAWAAADLRFAAKSPLMLLLMPGAEITNAQQYGNTDPLSGELQYAKLAGTSDGVQLNWSPPEWLESYVRDRAHDAHALDGIEAEGIATRTFYQAYVVEGKASTKYSTLWKTDEFMLRIEGSIDGRPSAEQREAWRSIVSRLETVSASKWLSAMPPHFLLPSTIPAVEAELLNGTPQLPGEDATEWLKNVEVIRRPELALRLFFGVQCDWTTAWLAARKRGDRAGMASIERTVANYPSWPLSKLAGAGRHELDGLGIFYEAIAHNGKIIYPSNTRDVSVDYNSGAGPGCTPVE